MKHLKAISGIIYNVISPLTALFIIILISFTLYWSRDKFGIIDFGLYLTLAKVVMSCGILGVIGSVVHFAASGLHPMNMIRSALHKINLVFAMILVLLFAWAELSFFRSIVFYLAKQIYP